MRCLTRPHRRRFKPIITAVRFCDLTFAYTATSGGIRTYLDQKRRYILEQTEHEHVLIVPGEEDAVEREGRATTYRIASPMIPGCEPYRFFCRPAALGDALREAAPDVIELGSFFLEPWTAFRYRKEQGESGRRCFVSGYFHTDLADAYVGSPVRAALSGQALAWSEHVAMLGSKLGDWIETGATSYFGSLFKKCDAMFAASPAQVQRLAGYGIDDALLVPLGVDLTRFHPRRRSADVRRRLGAMEGTALLVYAGRLDNEKRVGVLVDAFMRLARTDARLLLIGEGPMRAELEARAKDTGGLTVLPYEKNPEALADLLASADVYVTAGPHETFGLSVIEAQASGLPVVGVRSGALIERVPPSCGRLGAVDDAEEMARNIEEVLREARALGAAARAHVVDAGFGWDSTFKTLFAAYAAGMAGQPIERAG